MEVGERAHKMTHKPEHNHCMAQNLRMCPDGSCVSSLDLCTEEEKVNQNTILIMIIIGVAVIIAMVILYCFQQRSRRLAQNNNQGALDTIVQDGDNASLNNPPPAYDEVMGSNLYLPTTTSRQTNGASFLGRLPSAEEPMTPPPNYDAALTILGQSHESFFPKKTEDRNSSVVRRSVSTDTTVTAVSPTARSPTSENPNPFDFRRNASITENS